jgi:hypothetical protein
VLCILHAVLCCKSGLMPGTRCEPGGGIGVACLLRICIEAAQKLPRSCIEAAKKLPKSCPEAAQKLPRICLEVVQKLPRSCLVGGIGVACLLCAVVGMVA